MKLAMAIQGAREIAQSNTGRSLDAVAFLGGIAVWQQWVPTAVGIVTMMWLGAQLFMALPKLVQTWKWLVSLFGKSK